MKNITATLCLTIAVLLGTVGECFALPPCPEDTIANKDNCFGTYTFFNGDKYVGEWKNYKMHGQGTYTFADGRIKKGIWKNHKFQSAQKGNPPVIAKKVSPPSPSAAEIENKRLQKRIAELEKQKKQTPAPKVVAIKSSKPTALQFKKVPKRPDDVAVIIANSNYTKLGRDIPNVDPAYNDGESIKRYFMVAKGIREGNIIYLKDATGAQLTEVFGNERNHKAQLYNWVKPNRSNVYVYYAGHGAPASNVGSAFLVPVDAKPQTIEFSGYPLDNLYSNLGKIKARSVTVILEACFSGVSQAGALLPRSSGITFVAKTPKVPANVKVISAGSADQMASWEKDESQSLFTKYFLKTMSGEGDKNKGGKVDDAELQTYLEGTMTYYARRYYGRDQKVTIASG